MDVGRGLETSMREQLERIMAEVRDVVAKLGRS
jgi:hypothetical protein